jgi:hypothetical protein
MGDEFNQLVPGDFDLDVDQRIAADDDETILALSEVQRLRPDPRAWRDDPDCAPMKEPLYARESASMRVLMAIREEEGWVLITKDGECRPLPEVSLWAPISADRD